MRKAMLVWIALALAGCARVQVTTQAQPGTDFARFETYAVVPPPEGRPEIRELVDREIREELDARGFRDAPIEDADLVVVFRGSTDPRSVQRQVGFPGSTHRVIDNYVEGTLVIDFFDGRGGERVWHGVGTADIRNANNLEKAADAAVRAVLAEFPGKSPSGR